MYEVYECYCTHPATLVATFRRLDDAVAWVQEKYQATFVERRHGKHVGSADVTVEGCEPSSIVISENVYAAR